MLVEDGILKLTSQYIRTPFVLHGTPGSDNNFGDGWDPIHPQSYCFLKFEGTEDCFQCFL